MKNREPRRGSVAIGGILIGLALLGISVVVILFVAAIGLFNTEATKRIGCENAQKSVELTFDNVWKTISQTAQITDKNKEDFKEVYVAIMNQQKDAPGLMAKFLTQDTPQYDQSLMKRLMHIVEVKRDEDTANQKMLQERASDHKKFLTTFPGILMTFMGRTPFEAKFITSSRATEALRTGTDDDVQLFKKPAPASEPVQAEAK